jgi:hypothetical protein
MNFNETVCNIIAINSNEAQCSRSYFKGMDAIRHNIPPELEKQNEVPFARYVNKELSLLETLKWKLRHQPNVVHNLQEIISLIRRQTKPKLQST